MLLWGDEGVIGRPTEVYGLLRNLVIGHHKWWRHSLRYRAHRMVALNRVENLKDEILTLIILLALHH